MSEIEIKNPKLFSEYELSESEKITCKQSVEAQKERLLLAQLSEENRDLAIIGYIQGAGKYKAELDKAKTIIQDLLNNSDEYARQRAMDFLKEEEE